MADNKSNCQFYLPKKKRLCRFTTKPNATYCPEHACSMGVTGDRKRIPCPLNPNHNCYEDDLQKHLKKCNVAKARQAIEKQPYFVKDINKGVKDDCLCDVLSTLGSVRDLTSERLGAMIDKVNKLYAEVVKETEKLYLEHPRIKEEIAGNLNQDLTKAFGDQAVLRKELLQQASLVGQLENLGFLSKDHYYVELGAGKGKLSHWIYKASENCVKNSFLLVERSSVRYKVDPYHKGDKGNEGNFQRIKIDIQDLHLGKVPGIEDKYSVLVVGKHLCGGATDLGIRCAVNTLHPGSSLLSSHQQSPPKSERDFNSNASFESKSKELTNEVKEKSPEQSKIMIKTEELSAQENTSLSYEQNAEPSRNMNEGKRICEYDVGINMEPPTKVARLYEKEQRCKLQGIMIALCCHHRCTWDTYVGQEFMRRHSVNEEEFDILTRLSSWATCARTRIRGKTSCKPTVEREDEDSTSKTSVAIENSSNEVGNKEEGEEEEHKVEDLISANLGDSIPLREKLSVVERELVGRKAKRIIDQGRVEHLQSKNMNCFLREYISDDITPENIVLIAVTSREIPQRQRDL